MVRGCCLAGREAWALAVGAELMRTGEQKAKKDALGNPRTFRRGVGGAASARRRHGDVAPRRRNTGSRIRRSVIRIRTSARACGPRPAPRRFSLAWSRRRSTSPAMTRRQPRLHRSAWRRPAAWTTTRARGASSPAASCRPGGSTRSVSSPSGAPGVRHATTVTATTRTWRAVSTGQSSRADCARSSPSPWRNRRRWTVATSAPGTAGRCWTTRRPRRPRPTRPSRGRSSPGPSSG